jgi:hypothetical protein
MERDHQKVTVVVQGELEWLGLGPGSGVGETDGSTRAMHLLLYPVVYHTSEYSEWRPMKG